MSLLRSTSLSTVESVTQAPSPDPSDVPEEPPRPLPAHRRRLAGLLTPTSAAPIYLGVALIVAGFGLLAYTWSRVAGTAIVALQLPFIASGAFASIGLVAVGILSIHLGAKRRDAWQRDRRLDELASTLVAIASERAVADAGPEDPSD